MLLTTYLDHNKGNTNLIITAPHAGSIKPKDIPRRKYGKLLMDSYSGAVARYFINYFTQKPSYIIAKIHRSRVDFNRDIVEGAQGNPKAKELWKLWYKLLAEYTANRKSLYIDLHSHNDNDSFQLGYNLSREVYIDVKNRKQVIDDSSLQTLDHDLYDMLFGIYSIKNSLENMGYSVYDPKENEIYFNGGRNIEIFGKRVPAIQIEMPVSIIRNKPAKISHDLGAAIFLFKDKFVDT